MPISTENTLRFLESLHRHDLSILLSRSVVSVEEGGPDDWFQPLVIVRSPRPFSEAIASLPDHDRLRIAEAILSGDPDAAPATDIVCRTETEVVIEGLPTLLPELILQQQTMIDVATGGPAIQTVNDYYVARQVRLIELCRAVGSDYENPHPDLWDWYHHWKSHFATYSERRVYVRGIFREAISAAASVSSTTITEREPTGWERVDRALARAKTQLEVATDEEQFQAIGLLCREVMISLAQAVYDPKIHSPEDGIVPSPTDANRMLEAYVRHVFPGESNKEVRAHARAALALALNLQHRRTATRKLAALCVEASMSATSTIAIIADRIR